MRTDPYLRNALTMLLDDIRAYLHRDVVPRTIDKDCGFLSGAVLGIAAARTRMYDPQRANLRAIADGLGLAAPDSRVALNTTARLPELVAHL
jgi:hypothetical protein